MHPCRRFATIALVTIPALLAACANPAGVRDWNTIKEASFTQILPGRSTKADVEGLLGKPVDTWRFPALSQELWDYRYHEGGEPKILSVYFNPAGSVTQYLITIPRLYQREPLF